MSKVKKILAAVLVLCIVFGCVSVSAARKGPVYESDESNFVATKISHPESGIGEPDGIVEYDTGVNDRGQSYSWSAAGYGDYIYIGTCYAAIYSTIRIVARQAGMTFDAMKAIMNAAFNGDLYMGDEVNNPDNELRSAIIKINTKTGEAKIVSGPHNIGGFRAAIEFKDKLYFSCAGGTPYILEIDPKNNDAEKIVYRPVKKLDPSVSAGIRSLTTIGDKLVLSAVNEDGAYIVTSENPSLGQDSFKVIATQKDLLDYPAYHFADAIFGGSIFDMVEFNGKLYFTVVTGKGSHKQAFALFCGEEKKDGKWDFKLIVGDPKDGAKYPFGFGAERSGAANLVVHDDHLYIGGYNDPMVALPSALKLDFEPMYKDLSSPVCLWRLDKNDNAELIAGEPNDLFPEVKGNMGEGFGSNLNQYVWRMQSYNGKLYLGTFDISGLATPLQQFTNGDILKRTPEQWKSQIGYIIDVINELKKQPQALSVKNSDINVLTGTIKDMTALLDKGGIKDIKSTEKFHDLLVKAVAAYDKIKAYLPESITQQLDTVLTKENVQSVFYFLNVCKYLSQGEPGFDMLVSADGLNFDVVTRDGFGDKYNHGLRVFAVNNDGIFAGTANPFFGTQVWKIDEKTPAQDDTTKAPAEDKDDVKPDTEDKLDETVKKDEVKPQDSKDEAPNTGTTAGIALAVTALVAGAVLVITKKKKEF